MKIEPGVVMPSHPVCKKALKVCDRTWIKYGRAEGVTITSGMESTKIHSASSWHYLGCAFDCRTRYWPESVRKAVHADLKKALPGYDVIFHDTHIHIEPGDYLAKTWRLLR